MAVNKNILHLYLQLPIYSSVKFNNLDQAKILPTQNACHDKQLKNTYKLYEPGRIHLVNHLCEDSQKLYPICCFIFAKIANLVFTPLSNYFPSLWISPVHLLLFPIGTKYIISKALSSSLKGINLCI